MLISDKSRCDLHVHSCFSDGTDTPGELIENAKKNGVAAIALTDHNTIAGVRALTAASEGSGVIGVPGIEFTTEYNGTELHILGLFLKEKTYSQIEDYAKEQLKRKEESNAQCIDNLNKGGYAISYDKIKAENPNTSINRVHIAKELMAKGYISSVSEAFDGLLSKKGGFYKEPEKLSSLETIENIKSWGAAAVWAHPYLNMNDGQISEFISKAVNRGLCSIETKYPLYTPEESARLKKLAGDYGLLESGGSDYHGSSKPFISLGYGKGKLFVPGSVYNTLLEYVQVKSLI